MESQFLIKTLKENIILFILDSVIVLIFVQTHS